MTLELAMKMYEKNIITVCTDGEPLITMRENASVNKKLPVYFQQVMENCRYE